MSQNRFILNHPGLGPVVGCRVQSDTIQYRGVPYAILDNMFATAIPFANETKQTIDATSHGPGALQNPSSCDHEHALLQQALPYENLTFSGTECLNLTINVPDTVQTPCPVFVFIHGGGFELGGNAWPQHDLARLVALSGQMKSPVIGVGINYRLGALGFLTSEELRQGGIVMNRGLHDQITALKWIRNHIGGFGGDPSHITVIGNSVGAVSGLYHLNYKTPLFEQLICIGGTPFLVRPLPIEVAEAAYADTLDKLGITASTAEDRIAALKATKPEDLVTKLNPALPLGPVHDGELVSDAGHFSQLKQHCGGSSERDDSGSLGSKWCSRLMMGDNEMDSNVVYYMLGPQLNIMRQHVYEKIGQRLESHAHAKDAFQSSYGSKTDDLDELRILNFVQDIGFYLPNRAIAGAWPRDAYMFHFNEPNPWPGKFTGVATHVLDVAFLFQNYHHLLDKDQQQLAQIFARHIIEFVVGGEPWARYAGSEGKVQVYGRGAANIREVSASVPSEAGRRQVLLDMEDIVDLDTFAASFHDAMML